MHSSTIYQEIFMRIVTSTIRFDSRNRRKATTCALGNAVTSNAWDSPPRRPLAERPDPLLIPGFGPAPRWCDRIAEVILAVAVVTPFVVWWVLR
jgi:hypothetical protein